MIRIQAYYSRHPNIVCYALCVCEKVIAAVYLPCEAYLFVLCFYYYSILFIWQCSSQYAQCRSNCLTGAIVECCAVICTYLFIHIINVILCCFAASA